MHHMTGRRRRPLRCFESLTPRTLLLCFQQQVEESWRQGAWCSARREFRSDSANTRPALHAPWCAASTARGARTKRKKKRQTIHFERRCSFAFCLLPGLVERGREREKKKHVGLIILFSCHPSLPLVMHTLSSSFPLHPPSLLFHSCYINVTLLSVSELWCSTLCIPDCDPPSMKIK